MLIERLINDPGALVWWFIGAGELNRDHAATVHSVNTLLTKNAFLDGNLFFFFFKK